MNRWRTPRWLLVAVVGALATSMPAPAGPAAAAPERAQAGRGPDSQLRLASQTPWVGPGQELVLRVRASTPRPASEVEVAVAVYRRVTSRSEFTRTLEGRPRGAPLNVTSTPLSELATDTDGAVVVRLPVQDPGRPPEWPRLRLTDEGVYPVRVELREVDGGASLAEVVTHLVYASPPTEGGRSLAVSLVLPVHSPTAIRPDGTRPLGPDFAESVGTLAQSLNAAPNVPLTVAPTPETLDALASSPRQADRQILAELARGAARRHVAASSYVPISVPAFVAADLEEELLAQLDRGREVIERTMGIRADRRIWLADDRLDEPAVHRLRQHGADRLVLPESALAPVELDITPAQPFQLDVRAGRRPQVLTADKGLTSHFSPTDDPVLGAHRLLADLAMIYFDRPGRSRVVVVQAPRPWRASAAFLDTLLSGVGTSPILSGTTLDSAFSVPAATTPSGAPFVRRLAPGASAGGALPATAVRASRHRLEAFTSMLEADNPLGDRMEQLLLAAQGSELRPRQRGPYLEGLDATIDGQLRLIDVPRNRSVTLTARTGDIPVTILTRTEYPVRLRVQVASDKLEFPDGDVREIGLTRRNTTERFAVRARASGTFPLRVNLVSPDGSLTLGRSRLAVRSTAASGVGVALSAGAGLFLLVWWGRHQVRGRRNRRLVPA